MRYLTGRTGWPDTYEKKKNLKLASVVFPCHGMAELPRILFGHEGGKIYSQILRSRPGVCC